MRNAAFSFHARALALQEALSRTMGSTEIYERLDVAADWISTCLHNGSKVISFGNGGSAAAATHLNAELVGRVNRDRPPLPAICLADSTALLTAVANDYGYEYTFARPIRALGRPGDIALAFSTSGASPNVLKAVDASHELNMRVIALTGSKYSPLRERADCTIMVASDCTTTIQELTLHLVHGLATSIEQRLFGSDEPDKDDVTY